MENVDQRAVLARLITDRGEDFASLSRLLGKNAAYIQQFIKRGVPRKLDETDRRLLARYFRIADQELGGPAAFVSDSSSANGLYPIPRLDIGASAGGGAFVGEETPTSHIGFSESWLRQVSRGRPVDLSMIKVQGDSMAPTLSDGDDILVDAGDGADRLRDGIYVLRRDDALLVKRLALSPAANRVAIQSDNNAYPDWPDCDLETIDVIGRVVWAGRRLA